MWKISIFDIYERHWYLCTALVFTSDAGIYEQCWYLCMMLVFTTDTGIYAGCWYLRAMLVFMYDAGICEWCRYLWMMLLFMDLVYIYGSGIYGWCWYWRKMLKSIIIIGTDSSIESHVVWYQYGSLFRIKAIYDIYWLAHGYSCGIKCIQKELVFINMCFNTLMVLFVYTSTNINTNVVHKYQHCA